MRILPAVSGARERRPSGWTRGAAGLALLLAVSACSGREPDPFRHLVLISLDTTRADHLGCYGGSRVPTPRIDQLAREGILFEQAAVPAPSTLASHASLFTGLPPRAHGVPRNGFRVPAQLSTLAEMLRDAGFETAGFASSFALESRFGLDQGFEHWDEAFDLLASGDLDGFDQNQRRAEQVTDAALAFLDGGAHPAPRKAGESRRLFLFVHYFDPHVPYDPPPPWNRSALRENGIRRAGLRQLHDSVSIHYIRQGLPPPARYQMHRDGLTREILESADGSPVGRDAELAALYAGEIAYMDAHVGRLLDGLERRGILGQALVVLVGDHGESFWEHADYWNHGLWVYETTIRVPLLFRLPDGRGAGRRVGRPVSSLDVLPTLLELLRLPAPPGLPGQSLARTFSGGKPRLLPVVSEATQPLGAIEAGRRWPNELKPSSLRLGRYKLIRAPYLEREELYDLRADPGETRDLLRAPSEAASRLREELLERLAAFEQAHEPREPEPASDEGEVTARLQALGYGAPAEPASDAP